MPPTNTTAQIQLTANTSALPGELQRATGFVKSFASSTKALLTSVNLVPKKMAGKPWAATAFGSAVGSYAARGVDAIVAQGKAVFDFNDSLVRFGIAARQTPGQLEDIARAARATAAETGIDANEVLASARAYVDLAGAENFTVQKMNLLSRAAQATGSDAKDLAGMMYQLTRSMRVSDRDMEDTIGGLINQAKDGAIEAKEMAHEFAGILPLFARFGVLGREGTIQAGALFQVMRDGANSASEAGTMMQRVYAGIQSYAPRFEAQGVQIYKKQRDALGRKQLLPFDVIFRNIQKSEAMKDPALIKKMFGRTEGWRGMLLGDEAARALGGTDSKIDASISRLQKLQDAGRANGIIMQDLKTYTDSAAGRMAVAMERMKNAIAEAFTPERIEKFVGAIEGMVDKVGPLTEMMGKIGDVLGAVYGAGKKIRGVFSDPVGPALADLDQDQVDRVAIARGINANQAYRELEDIYGRARNLKIKIRDSLDDNEKPTHATNMLAARALMQPPTQAGMLGEREVADQYFRNLGMSKRMVAQMVEDARKEMIDEDIASGRSASKKPEPDLGAQLIHALRTTAPDLGRSIAQAMPPTTLKADGNKLASTTKNSTDRRRHQ